MQISLHGSEAVVDRLAGMRRRFGGFDAVGDFLGEAELFPGAWFAMGYDTAMQLVDPRYHADVPAMLERFIALESRFVVAGRLHQGAYHGLDRLPIDSGIGLFSFSEALFREDISSTELRSTFDRD